MGKHKVKESMQLYEKKISLALKQAAFNADHGKMSSLLERLKRIESLSQGMQQIILKECYEKGMIIDEEV